MFSILKKDELLVIWDVIELRLWFTGYGMRKEFWEVDFQKKLFGLVRARIGKLFSYHNFHT